MTTYLLRAMFDLFLNKDGSDEVTPPSLPLRSFFEFIGCRLDGTSHPSGSRSTVAKSALKEKCQTYTIDLIFS